MYIISYRKVDKCNARIPLLPHKTIPVLTLFTMIKFRDSYTLKANSKLIEIDFQNSLIGQNTLLKKETLVVTRTVKAVPAIPTTFSEAFFL